MLGKGLFFLLGFLSLASWVSLGGLIIGTSPESFVARVFFFALLFAGVFFVYSLLVFYVSMRLSSWQWRPTALRFSVLGAVPPAGAFIVAAWLQTLRAFSLASALVLLAAVLLIEITMIVNGRRNRETRRIEEVSH